MRASRALLSTASATEAATERCRLLEGLSQYADFFTLDTCAGIVDGTWSLAEWVDHLAVVVEAAKSCSPPRPILLCLPSDLDMPLVNEILQPAVELGVKGVVVGGGVRELPASRVVGVPTRQASLRMVHFIHSQWGERLPIVGSGGVHEPEDALRLLEAGATLVQVHSGLVYSGPGLPKRINEAVAHFSAQQQQEAAMAPVPKSFVSQLKHGWLWMMVLGIALIMSSILVALVAVTRVILPYDEAFAGITREQIGAINDRLLPFMVHDRVTLAGTMLSIGILYLQLAIHGVRKGEQWARLVIVVSCLVGFVSFFLFLGFGYFDLLHAVLAIVLLVFFLLGLRWPAPQAQGKIVPNLRNDRLWLLSQWGQFLFVGIGVALTGAGLVIATIGVTTVFVPEDLAFLHTTQAALHASHPELISLIAHDRAGFGGALVSDGLGLLLLALWGFRQGARWVWWTLVGVGISGFVATVGIHLTVGYTNVWHLAPTFLIAFPYTLGLILSYPYLCLRADPVLRCKC